MAAANKPLLRVMVDANILIAGIGWPRFPYEVLQHAVHRDFQLVLSSYIIDEARRNIVRVIPQRLPQLELFIARSRYEETPTPTEAEVDAHLTLIRDKADISVALAAINAKVDYLVTQDRDFTDRNESNAELHAKLKIILPSTFLREHMGWTSEALETVRNRTWRDLQ